MAKQLILCNCIESLPVDKALLARASGLTCSRIHSRLCTSEADQAARAIQQGDAVIACTQERAVFEEIAADLDTPPPVFVDLRDRAGWSENGADAGPKMAALLNDALMVAPAAKALDISSEGVCLILGPADIALSAAEQLSQHLSVTVLLTEKPPFPPTGHKFDVILGRLKTVRGSLGNFQLRFDALQQIEPGGRGDAAFGAPQDGATSNCDLLLDFSGNTPLFPAPEKRDGYLRADPASPTAVAKAILDVSHMVGTFEKPLYLKIEDHLCAHSRAGQVGCHKCLDACPTGAIQPDGDHVAIDPLICAGCAACSVLCPSGAITYDDPPVSFLFSRIQSLAETYLSAGGNSPRLLVCDHNYGLEMISLSARFGRGIPADVIPLELEKISGFGHAEILAALASGFASVDILLAPDAERAVIEQETELARVLSGQRPIRILDIDDPDALSDTLFQTVEFGAGVTPILPLGSRRQIARLAAKTLLPDNDTPIALPESAPYGTVMVDTDACTLCLACVSLCPAGALADNSDMPQLRFQEDACLQCGLCSTVCPENAISLKPQLDLSDVAFTQRVLHEEEPYPCIECGKLFGVKSTVEKIVEKLEGKHEMFADSDTARLIRMCDDCRINAQYHSDNNPFSGADRPRVHTTEDYFSRRKDH